MNWNRSTAHQIWGKVSVMDALSQNLARFGFEGKGRGDTTSVLLSLGQTFTIASDFVTGDTFVPFGRLEDGIPDIATPDTSTGRVPLPSNVPMLFESGDPERRDAMDADPLPRG